jgi:integrase
MRNDRRVLRNLSAIAKGAGVRTLDDATIDLVDLYRAKRPISALTWTKELASLKHFFAFCKKRKWIQDNPAEDVKPPKIRPKPKEPFTRAEVARIIAACESIGRRPYERLRARAIVLLLRYTALRVSDVAQLARDRIRCNRMYLYTQKSGKPVFLPMPPALLEALRSLPVPTSTEGESKHFFWSGPGHNQGVDSRRDPHACAGVRNLRRAARSRASVSSHLGNRPPGTRLDYRGCRGRLGKYSEHHSQTLRSVDDGQAGASFEGRSGVVG